MQRATATAGRWVGALSAGLALPFSFAAHAGARADPPRVADSGVLAGIEAAADDSVLSRWHAYALSSITPQFTWALMPPADAAPRLLDTYSGRARPSSLFESHNASAIRLGVSVATGNVADTPSVMPDRVRQWTGLPQTGLQRTVVTPSVTGDWGEHGSVRLTGVLAYQRFASLGLGVGTTAGDNWALVPAWRRDTSYGAGARVDAGNALGERLSWNIGYQSRIGMAAFSNYRGVFADPGEFDIPASATASMRLALTPEFGVDVGVQRVMYSAITPFASASLPTRFLALLGDGASPVFAWRDLDVYSVGWSLRDDAIGTLQMRYTTRQQPVPTSKLLERALAPATANDMISLGWSRSIGAYSDFGFSANYASSPYYLLMPTYLSRNDATAGRFEFEALWSTRF